MKNKLRIKFHLSSHGGFTLIELLTVMVVFVSVSGIVVAILFSALRGTNKTNTVDVVRQNGNYVISQMTKMIRFAKKLESTCNPTLTSIAIKNLDDGQTIFSCCSTLPATIASSSGTENCTPATRTSLLNTNAVALVSCSFTCNRTDVSDMPIIGINFSLNRAGSSSFVERIASATAIPFQTSVSMRNSPR